MDPYMTVDQAIEFGRTLRMDVRRVKSTPWRGIDYINNIAELRKYKHLACWCPLDKEDCHVETLLKILKGRISP